jgi:hypothetical protein
MRGDAKAVVYMMCGLGLLYMLGFWISAGLWPFAGEGPGTTLLKSVSGDDFAVTCWGDIFMRAALGALFVAVTFLAWTLWEALEEEDEEADENIKDGEDEGDEPEIEIEE